MAQDQGAISLVWAVFLCSVFQIGAGLYWEKNPQEQRLLQVLVSEGDLATVSWVYQFAQNVDSRILYF
jgi:hypothetical protein